ncbi:hypothetical protein NCC49_003982 [Naganishia albida]|nr:hypothetical protein NCC49_003982 [Naganishia albida]
MERKTSTGDLDEKGGITLAHVKEWIQSTARAFMESRRWTSLCGATAKLALAKFQSIEQLVMNMKLDDDNNEQVRLQLSQAMEDSVRCYVTVCSVAKNLLASFAAAGLYCKWNGGGEVSSERRYAAVPLAEPRKRGVVSVKMTSHKTQPRTLDFWGPAMSDTQVASRVLSGVLRLSSIAVESELSVKAVKLQKETAEALSQALAQFEDKFTFGGRPVRKSGNVTTAASYSQTLEANDSENLGGVVIGVDCGRFSQDGLDDRLGKGAFTVLFPTPDNAIPFQTLGQDPRRILQTQNDKDSIDSSADLAHQIAFLRRVKIDVTQVPERRAFVSRQDVDLELRFLHEYLDRVLGSTEKQTQLGHKAEAFKTILYDRRDALLSGNLPEELEASANEYWNLARQYEGTTLKNATLQSKGSYCNLKYMVDRLLDYSSTTETGITCQASDCRMKQSRVGSHKSLTTTTSLQPSTNFQSAASTVSEA